MADKKSFELDSGLLDNYEVVVENAEFGYREVYRGGEVPLLILYCASPDTETREELFSIGNGWEVAGGGERVEGRPTFLASSWMGRLIVRCNELDMPGFDGGDDGSVLDFIADRGDAQDAHIWVGLKFKMHREDVDFGEGIGVKQHIMPTECLGLLTATEATAFAESGDEADDFADSGEVDFDEAGSDEFKEQVQEKAAELQPEAEPEADKQDEVVLALLKSVAEEADTVVAFQTTVVSSYASTLSGEWLGRLMDADKAKELYEELRE